jgi:uncharacterized spore protein YtfJ
MDAMSVLTKTQESISQRTVFGEPIIQDGVTIIPVARVSGGGGGGGGGPAGATEEASGAGAGFGMRSRPVGVFVVKDGNVSWRPSLDLNRVILGGQVVAVVALLTIRSILKRRRRH